MTTLPNASDHNAPRGDRGGAAAGEDMVMDETGVEQTTRV
jgi:hypothetical protein